MRIVIATALIPFVHGGAEILAVELQNALTLAGHEVEIVAIPFKWHPPERILDHALACRLLDLTESSETRIDRLIALKFPAYLIPHPNKILWLIHQYRQAYDLWNDPLAGSLEHFPSGNQVRFAIRDMDLRCIPEAKRVYTIAKNVSSRLQKFCGIPSKPLYHPPANAGLFHSREAEPYLFFPSRLTVLKRQELVLRALQHTRQPVTVKFAGPPERPSYLGELKKISRDLKVADRVTWMGTISEEEKIRQYAGCLAVVFPPNDEDYGYVTLEAMLSSKPVLTCLDSGGPNEFVLPDQTGIVVQPTPERMAEAMDRIWSNRADAQRLGAAGRDLYSTMKISWSNVVAALLA